MIAAMLSAVAPVFGLVLLGFVAGRCRILGPNASGELNRFVVMLALPVLLFDIVARAPIAALRQSDFLWAFALGSAGIYILPLLWRLKRRVPLVDAALQALGVGYANVGFMGIPLALLVFGASGGPLTVLATIFTASALFAGSIVIAEIGVHREKSLGACLLSVSGSLLRNPLIIAPALGAIVAAADVRLPALVTHFTGLLGAAASPCALVALGLFLSATRPHYRSGAVWVMVLLKLVAQPALTWALAFHVFSMAPRSAFIAVLLSALPTGTGPFMLAEFYRRDATEVASVILLSTVGSLFTLSLILGWGASMASLTAY